MEIFLISLIAAICLVAVGRNFIKKHAITLNENNKNYVYYEDLEGR